MSSLVDTIFGGTDDSSQKAQIAANKRAQEFIEEQSALARGDVQKYIPQGAEAARQGFEAAYNLQKQTIPTQIGAVRGGNIRAQESLLGGMGMVNDAIMGRPVDESALKVSSLGPATANIFRNNTPPAFLTTPIQQQQPQQQQAQMTPEQLQQLLAQALGGQQAMSDPRTSAGGRYQLG